MSSGTSDMNSTLFPARPADVVALTTTEFMFELEMNNAPSLEEVCRRFGNDANRALVWLIRFCALRAWCAGEEAAKWPNAGSRTLRDICDVAASFELNDRWEFDADAFCLSVDRIVSQRSRLQRY
jgi:hypothetical protein